MFLYGEYDMKVFLAGVAPWRSNGLYDKTVKLQMPYILESFYYADKDTERLMPYYGDFLLDSGAFTFMQNAGSHCDWDEYVKRYADFINRNDVKKFLELDIDSVVGYEKVLRMREQLEAETGKRCIPVWHPQRGIDEFRKSCEDYNYVAVGGVVSKDISFKAYSSLFPGLITMAHVNGSKVHGLGLTNMDLLSKCHFDSVDSSSWTAGNRFGLAYYFDGKKLIKQSAGAGQRIGNSWALAVHNFNEWVKFQKYAENNL